MQFVWDEEKDLQNIRKHGLPLSVGRYVFDDPDRLEYYDTIHNADEDRYITIGSVNNVLVVVYTMRGSDCRLISVRRANKAEERLYYGYGYCQNVT